DLANYDPDPLVAQLLTQLASLLTPGEKVIAVAPQDLLLSVLAGSRRGFVAATTNRLIFIARPLLGGFSMSDFQWTDLSDARISAGIMTARLHARTRSGRAIEMVRLTKDRAQKLYVICQQQEQVWREKNRVREMEQHRAQHGYVLPGNGGFAAGSSSNMAA